MAIDPDLITTVRVGELPTGTMSLADKFPRELEDNILYQGTIQELLDLLRPLVGKMQYEKVVLYVDNQYILDNFDLTPGATMGLGINLCDGFAIANGNNGTPNVDGRCGIAYGATHSAVGAIGGAATHTLSLGEIPSHTHDLPADASGSLSIQSLSDTAGTDEGFNGTHFSGASGGGGAHNNMQPYIVELTIMKL